MKIKKISLALAVLFLGLITAVNVALAVDSEAACNGKSAGSKCEYNDPIEEKGSCCRIYYKAADDTKGLFCDYRTNYAVCCGKTQGSACSFFGTDARKGYETNGIEERKGTCKVDTTIHNTIGLLVCEIPPNSTVAANNSTTSTNATASNNSANTGASISTTFTFPNPIKASTMSEFLGNILNALLGVVAFISLIFIIIGAVMYMLSAGNEQAIERAKKTITGAVVGLAIAAAAPTFLKTIKSVLGGASGTNADDIVNKAYTLKDIAINVLNFLLSVTGIVAIIGLIVGAIFYLTSYGNEERMEKGKKILVASVIGIIVAFSSLVIVRQVANLIAAQ